MTEISFALADEPPELCQQGVVAHFAGLGSEAWTDVWISEPLLDDVACRILSVWLQAPAEWPRFTDGYSHPGISVWPEYFRPELLELADGTEVLGVHQREVIAPLILRDDFEEGWVEPRWFVPEELRLAYRLLTEDGGSTYVEHTEDGSTRQVIRVSDDRVSMRTDLILRYAAAKQMDVVYSVVSDIRFPEKEGVGLKEHETVSDDCYAALYLGSHGQPKCVSRLVAIKRTHPGPIENSGIYPYQRARLYESFVVDEDVSGNEVTASSDPGTLANLYFTQPTPKIHSLTPVHFDREVLRRYRDNPSRYEVGQCDVSCHGIWRLRSVDMNHDDRVVAYLGDLGSLPTQEQRHWRVHNISPDGVDISGAQFRRDFLAQFASNTALDLVVREQIQKLNVTWQALFGWPLFLAANAGDEHLIDQISIPLTEDMSEFDRQIMVLSKVIVDFLNQAEFDSNANGSLNKFQEFLDRHGFVDSQSTLEPLRKLQGLRSYGAAHRKSGDYFEKSGVDGFIDSFRDLLVGITRSLHELTQFAETNDSAPQDPEK